jgi:hypothetical protein
MIWIFPLEDFVLNEEEEMEGIKGFGPSSRGWVGIVS